MEKYKKITSLFVLMIILISSLQGIVAGATQISSADLKAEKDIDTNVEFYDGTQWFELEAKYIYYKANGKEYPAYCISHGLDGVDEQGNYTIDVSKLLNDTKIWRTIINGYPYKTPAQMGLSTKYEAYFATKQAIYCVILNRDINLYRGITEEGKKIVNAIKNLKNIGLNGTQTPQDANLKINKSSSFIEDGNYYSQAYKVSSDVNIKSFKIEKITGFPEGSFIANTKGNKQTLFNSGENFKIMIPKSKLGQNVNGIISISSECETHPIFYRKNKNSRHTRLCINL